MWGWPAVFTPVTWGDSSTQGSKQRNSGGSPLKRTSRDFYNLSSRMHFKSSTNKPQFTEQEAAQQLGITTEELRILIRSHIVTDENDTKNLPMTSFQHSDLLLLRLLSNNSLSNSC